MSRVSADTQNTQKGAPKMNTFADGGNVRKETFVRFCKGGASGLISAFVLQPL
jgi:hypothetical protein